MATITVKISKKGLRKDAVEKFVAGAQKYEWAKALALELIPVMPGATTEEMKAEAASQIEKIIWKHAPFLPAEVAVSVSIYEPPESRAARLSEAEDKVDDARGEVTTLKEELESWRDNLPEQFEDKRSEIDDAINQLEEIEQNLDQVEFNVSFPGAFGQ